MTMLERCARAICQHQIALSAQFSPRGVEKQSAKYWQDWVPEVQVILNEMREPTEAMVLDAVDAWHERKLELLDDDIKHSWSAMIDSALNHNGRSE